MSTDKMRDAMADGQRIAEAYHHLKDATPPDVEIDGTIDLTPTPQGMRQMVDALLEQVEKSEALAKEAEDRLEHPTTALLNAALQALIEREEARIARITSGLDSLR